MTDYDDPREYEITYCFDTTKDSCIRYIITIDGEIENKPALLDEHLESIGPIVHMDDGTMCNMMSFVYAYINEVDEEVDKPTLSIIK